MPNENSNDEIVFKTKWFSVAARKAAEASDPHYLIDTNDFVSIVAVDGSSRLLLVRQFRPAVESLTLEIPSGHVEIGETPEQAARKELLEETGHVAKYFELLGSLSPCIGRYRNRLWCYFAPDAHPADQPDFQVEEGVEPVLYDRSLSELIHEKDFISSLSVTSLMLAIVEKRLSL